MDQCNCPKCGSKAFKRNGYTRHGKQNHRCLDCGRQFSSNIEFDEDFEKMVGVADYKIVFKEDYSTNTKK
ncbi:Transposase [Candidatus Rubidus massiliensis]|nr:MAG: hypothetical protein BGO10_01900 [Chlamydia sp. 32-24]CDZ81339.1 Transposase [Candidatus Rubidus massiliensis]